VNVVQVHQEKPPRDNLRIILTIFINYSRLSNNLTDYHHVIIRIIIVYLIQTALKNINMPGDDSKY
jgi:hypothetical protein